MEALRVRDGVSRKQISDALDLSKYRVENLFKGVGVEQSVIDEVAKYFEVDAVSLREGKICPVNAGETVLKAYRLVTPHFLPDGDFFVNGGQMDLADEISNWENLDFRALKLDANEFKRLLALLNQRYIVRTIDGRYERLKIDNNEMLAYVRVLGKAMESVATGLTSSNGKIAKQFVSSFNIACTIKDPRDFYVRQRDVITSFAVQYPYLHAWALEFWNRVQPAMETPRRSKIDRAKKEDLGKALARINEQIENDQLEDPSALKEPIRNYFGILGSVVIAGL